MGRKSPSNPPVTRITGPPEPSSSPPAPQGSSAVSASLSPRAGRLSGGILHCPPQTIDVPAGPPAPAGFVRTDSFVACKCAVQDPRVGHPGGGPAPIGAIEHMATDPKNALLRDLARRLHRHRIAAVHLQRGASLLEIENLLEVLSTDPKRGEGPVGKRLDRVGPGSISGSGRSGMTSLLSRKEQIRISIQRKISMSTTVGSSWRSWPLPLKEDPPGGRPIRS